MRDLVAGGAQVLPGKGAVSAARAKLLQAHYKTPGAASAAAAATAASNAAGETICTRNRSCADVNVITQHMHTTNLTLVHGQAADAGAGHLVLSCRLCYARAVCSKGGMLKCTPCLCAAAAAGLIPSGPPGVPPGALPSQCHLAHSLG